MKNFKNMLVIVALFAIGSVSAKRMATKTVTPPTKPVITPAPAQEIVPVSPKPISIKSKNQLLNDLRTMQSSNMTTNNQFTDNFIKSVMSSSMSDEDKMELLESAAIMQQKSAKNNAENYNKLFEAAKGLPTSKGMLTGSEQPLLKGTGLYQ